MFKKKEYLPIMGAIAIPLCIILFAVVSIYWPASSLKSKYNFLYTTDSSYNNNWYAVRDNKLVDVKPKTSASPLPYYDQPPKLYVYDMANNQTKKLTFEETQQLTLSDQPFSPDGFQVVSDYDQEFGLFPFLFFGETERGIYLKKDKAKKKLEISPDNYYNFQLYGWITNP